MHNTKAIILAAGLGTRMKSALPKVMHEVGSKSLLERVICSLKNADIKDIVVVVGYKADLIKKAVNGVNFVEQKVLLGSGDAVKSALPEIRGFDGSILIACGDMSLIKSGTYSDLVGKHVKSGASCTILTSEFPEPHGYGRIVRDKSGAVQNITEEKDATPDEKKIKEINTGTYCFKSSVLSKYIGEIKENTVKKEYYLTDIIGILSKNKEKVITVHCEKEEAMGINSRADLAEANRVLNAKTLAGLMENGVTIVDPLTTWIAEGVNIGQDTVIFPNTVIENDVRIGANCKIGPFARIRPGTKISDDVEIGNFVEICRTEIGEKTKVKHHTYLGDAVVGKNVNIGAGTITANYDGKNKNRTVIKDNVFVGVGAVLIAPVELGRSSVVGAGSVVTKNKNVPEGATVVGVPARLFGK
ncbi:MAG: NTP transferase domain-containing protein [Candidatus Omnitrophica bacterium]|nr:NTP transferase domain-containing protein [Candidatus Omnitrophota bacterium]